MDIQYMIGPFIYTHHLIDSYEKIDLKIDSKKGVSNRTHSLIYSQHNRLLVTFFKVIEC